MVVCCWLDRQKVFGRTDAACGGSNRWPAADVGSPRLVVAFPLPVLSPIHPVACPCNDAGGIAPVQAPPKSLQQPHIPPPNKTKGSQQKRRATMAYILYSLTFLFLLCATGTVLPTPPLLFSS
jgi:hypothetical protein